MELDATPLETDQSYKVSTPSFLQEGGDGCTAFSKGTGRVNGL